MTVVTMMMLLLRLVVVIAGRGHDVRANRRDTTSRCRRSRSRCRTKRLRHRCRSRSRRAKDRRTTRWIGMHCSRSTSRRRKIRDHRTAALEQVPSRTVIVKGLSTSSGEAREGSRTASNRH